MAPLKISLRAARTNAGLSQERVAQELRVAKQTVHNWEKGKTEPTVSQAMALQELLQISLEHIIFGKKSAESVFKKEGS